MNDTIASISTALGVGAISIVRLSGKEAIKIVNSCFDHDLTKVKSHTINYGHIISNKKIIDEVLVSVMKSPKTYTTEDIVEINCHGGIMATNKVLETVLNHGARQAEPGEFTKRAFLNGRLDLIESEAVMDTIEAKSDESRQIAINQLNGETTKLITNFRNKLKDLISAIEVNIDYPEYEDIEIMTENKVKATINTLEKDLKEIIKSSENTMLAKNGLKVVILGRPNVGKSSILNKLLHEDKAIVTDIAGTTRDVVEGSIYLDGLLLNIIDTAGIRETTDKIESIGVEKSLQELNKADLVLVVLNKNEKLTKEDELILVRTKAKTRIIILNKNDLSSNLNINNLNLENVIETNTTNDEGLQALTAKIKELFNLEKITSSDLTYLSNARQISLAKKSLTNLNDAKEGLAANLPLDMVEIDLKDCLFNLGSIVGENYDDEIIDNLFAKFCVGK
jgi:tRNA modification GTPase